MAARDMTVRIVEVFDAWGDANDRQVLQEQPFADLGVVPSFAALITLGGRELTVVGVAIDYDERRVEVLVEQRGDAPEGPDVDWGDVTYR